MYDDYDVDGYDLEDAVLEDSVFDTDESALDGDVESDLREDSDIVNTESEMSEELADVSEQENDTREQYRNMGLDEDVIDALLTAPDERSWRQVEMVDEIRHPSFESQRSFIYDELEGYRDSEHGEKESQRPDLIKFTDDGIEIREEKSYTNAYALSRNIMEQAQDRFDLFGEDLKDLTFVVAPNQFTLEDAERISEAAYQSGADIEWLMK